MSETFYYLHVEAPRSAICSNERDDYFHKLLVAVDKRFNHPEDCALYVDWESDGNDFAGAGFYVPKYFENALDLEPSVSINVWPSREAFERYMTLSSLNGPSSTITDEENPFIQRKLKFSDLGKLLNGELNQEELQELNSHFQPDAAISFFLQFNQTGFMLRIDEVGTKNNVMKSYAKPLQVFTLK